MLLKAGGIPANAAATDFLPTDPRLESLSWREIAGTIRRFTLLPFTPLQNPAHQSKIERRLTGLVGSRLFLYAFFGGGILAFIVGWHIRGPIIVALPLLVWCPFLLIISLHEGAAALRRIRYLGAPILPAAYHPAALLAITIYLFCGAVRLLRYHAGG
jgi:hypothetical protein